MCHRRAAEVTTDVPLSIRVATYQQNLYGAQYVHGSGEGGPQVETESHCSSKLGTQRSGDHIVRATGFTEIESPLDVYQMHSLSLKIHISYFLLLLFK